MVDLLKTRRARACYAAGALLVCAAGGASPPERPRGARMSVITGKDVGGTVYKKLALPNLKYCWNTCIKDEPCSGARWGVIRGDVAGLCVLLRGELTLKALTAPQTDDGKPIHVIAARKLLGVSPDGT